MKTAKVAILEMTNSHIHKKNTLKASQYSKHYRPTGARAPANPGKNLMKPGFTKLKVQLFN